MYTSTIFSIKILYLHFQCHVGGRQSILQIMQIKKIVMMSFNLKMSIFSSTKIKWGLLLLEVFGSSQGTGDYGHLTVEHGPMLFRVQRSLHHLSNQGSEAAHKLQQQLYARATSHDLSGDTASCKFISIWLGCSKLYTQKKAKINTCQCCWSFLYFPSWW